jgi:predicted membrane channel-forming protein YqfA (hemolysin III family)
MGKPVLQLAAFGVIGVILWKLLAGVLFGVLFTVFKIAFFVALVWFGVWAFKRWTEKKKDEKPAEGTP